MASQAVNPTEFRDGQRKQWSVAAHGWKKHSDWIDARVSGVSQRLVELAGVAPGSRVLDVAAGYGEPSLTAARVVGPDGSVVATDISAEMLAFGRERAAAAGVSNIEFIESDAVSLDFPPDTFDAAVSRWGIIFDPDGEGAAARVREFLKPGAKFAISSWGPPERAPFLALPMRVVMQRLGVPPPAPGTPGPLSRPTAEAIGGLLKGGGFTDIAVEETEVTFEYTSPEEFTSFVREIAPPVTAMMADRSPEVQQETWTAIAEAAREEVSEPDGSLRLTNQVLMASGKA